MSSIPIWNYALGLMAAATALYIFIFYDALNARSGAWIAMDVWVALAGILLLLMASRRVLGPALAIIAIVFLGYFVSRLFYSQAIFKRFC